MRYLSNYMMGGVAFAPEGGTGAGDPPPPPWYQGKLDDVMIGHLQNRGWHDKPVETVAIEALRAHKEAEGYIGVPANRIIKLPATPDDKDGWKSVHAKLGVPAAIDGYDFKALKTKAGEAIDTGFDQHMRASLFANNVPASAAPNIVADVQKYIDGMRDAEASAYEGKLVEEKTALKTSWGVNSDVNLGVARKGAAMLGVDAEAVAALEKTIGYAKVMEMFRKVGAGIQEDNFHGSGDPPRGGAATREQALAEKSELMADEGFVKKFLAGDKDAVRKMTALDTIITGE